MANTLPTIVDDPITTEQFQRVLPKDFRSRITPEVIKDINAMLVDPALRENYRDNLLSYTGVMQDGKYKIKSYVDAVRYVSFKLLGSSNIEAYTKTFPSRFQRLVNEGADSKTISSYCAAYSKTQLVIKILAQTLMPTHIINADMYQKALNVQAYLMSNATSEKVRTDAANSLLTHLKPPETQKIELDIAIKEDKSLIELREATLALAAQQRELIKSGAVNVLTIAESKVITGESKEI